VSIALFAALLAGGSLILGIASFAIPAQPGIPPRDLPGFKLLMAALYAIPLGIAIWWLIQFNLRSTKDAFTNADPDAPASARPLSMSIIGWYMLVAGVGCLYPVIAGFPGFFAGGVFTGWSARVMYLVIGAVEFFAGAELLHLRERGRLAAIAVCSVSLVNALALLLVPGAASRAAAFEHSRFASLASHATITSHASLMTGAWIGLLALVPLWFLLRRKAAFQRAA
jgi:uncharacterized membrane protein